MYVRIDRSLIRTTHLDHKLLVILIHLVRVLQDKGGSEAVHILTLEVTVDPVSAVLGDVELISEVVSCRDGALKSMRKKLRARFKKDMDILLFVLFSLPLRDPSRTIHVVGIVLKHAVGVEGGRHIETVVGVDDEGVVRAHVNIRRTGQRKFKKKLFRTGLRCKSKAE